MRLLVTGGAGYIGSIVSARLLSAGHQVTVVDDLSTGHREAVPAGARLVQLDLLDRDGLRGALAEGFDGVLHFAARALVGESVESPDLYRRVNVEGSESLLDAMREGEVGRIVVSSTCAVYGHPERIPITEDVPERPINPYGETKLAVDRMLADRAGRQGLGAVSLRYFNVAGAEAGLGEDHRPETHLVPRCLMAALGEIDAIEIHGTDYPTPDGTAIRDYLHVGDLAHAHLLALDAIVPGSHRVFNLGTGTGCSVREVVETAREVTGVRFTAEEGPRRAGDPPVLVAANDRAAADLGWAPEATLEQIIDDAWTFHRSNPGGY